MNLQLFLALWTVVNTNYVSCGKTGIHVPKFSMEGVCPSESIREDLRSTLHQEVRKQLQNFIQELQDEGMTA